MKEIFTRRSIRKFTAEPVSPEATEKLLRAAMNAPSACNKQPWEFIVVRSQDTLGALRKVSPYARRPLATAPLAIVVCGDVNRECAPGFWVEDCSAATQNLLLEAEHLGLGAVWMGLYPMAEPAKNVAELFSVPENVIPLCIIAIGHPDEHPEPVSRYQPDRVHEERW